MSRKVKEIVSLEVRVTNYRSGEFMLEIFNTLPEAAYLIEALLEDKDFYKRKNSHTILIEDFLEVKTQIEISRLLSIDSSPSYHMKLKYPNLENYVRNIKNNNVIPLIIKPLKVNKTNMISANDIAKLLNLKGIEVRSRLRKLKIPKPKGGWAWHKEEAEKIVEKIR